MTQYLDFMDTDPTIPPPRESASCLSPGSMHLQSFGVGVKLDTARWCTPAIATAHA